MVYSCEDCGKTFEKKANLEYHLNKKNSCTEDKIINLIKEKGLKHNEYKNYVEKLECFICDKKFSRRDNLTRHLKNGCKGKRNGDDNKIQQLEEENQKLKKIIQQQDSDIEAKLEKIFNNKIKKLLKIKKNNTENKNNNSHNSNSNNTVKINSENVNKQNIFLNNYTGGGMPPLSPEQIEPLLRRGFQTPVELTRAIHFNPNYPEFHNIYLPKINEKNAMVFIDGNWQATDRDIIIEDIYENKRSFVLENLNKYINKIEPAKQKSLNRWLNTSDNEEESIINTKMDIQRLLYNNRHMAMNRKKELEKQNKKNPSIYKLETTKEKNKKLEQEKKFNYDSDSSYISNYSYDKNYKSSSDNDSNSENY